MIKLSVCTSMMRKDYTPEETVRLIKDSGYDGIEWGLDENYNIDIDEAYSKPEFLKNITDDAGLEIVSYSPGPCLSEVNNYKDKIKKYFDLALKTNVKKVRFWSSLYGGNYEERKNKNYNDLLQKDKEGIGLLIRDMKPEGIKVIIEMHFGYITNGPSNSYRLITGFSSDDVGIILDPGNMLVEGMEAWKLGMEVLGPYLAHVHCRNLVWKFDQDRKSDIIGKNGWYWDFANLEDGLADWREIIASLNSVGYNGYISLEDFSPRPIEERLSQINLLRKWANMYK